MKGLFTPAEILLPRAGTDMTKWAALACDQFSSDPGYWRDMEAAVGAAPSALRLMLPEAYLTAPDAAERQSSVWRTMERYLAEGVFTAWPDSCIYVERTLPGGAVRRGLVGKLDLELYDWREGSRSPVRATEATVPERLPARVELRRRSALEMPHIVLFMDDRRGRVFAAAEPGQLLYDFDLYGGAGHIRGFRIAGKAAEAVCAAIDALEGEAVFLMGDGNHSLAAAKARWEQLKAAGAPADHPARYALAELEDLHDQAVAFRPIHRAVLDTDAGGFLERLEGADTASLVAQADALAAAYVAEHGGRVDYIHGEEQARAIAQTPGGGAWLLPAMDKGELFPHALARGVYPKKSFSVGEALEKRWYVECRRIRLPGDRF